MSPSEDQPGGKLEANLSSLIFSIASSAAMALGMAPDPQTGEAEIDLNLARFNIDLLEVLKVKTINNLDKEEEQLLSSVLSDLQVKFVEKDKK